MARRPNELFDKEKIKNLCENVIITQEQKDAAKEWLELLKKDELRDEQKNQSKFERIVLEKILGYTVYDYVPEDDNVDYIITDKSSGASLCLEVKGTSTPSLDALQKGRGKEHETPIKQTWVYMGLGHDYGVCTNYNEFAVLLSQEKTWTRSHRFKFESIEDSREQINTEKLQEFIGLFSKSRIFSEKIYESLLKETVDAEEEFTEEFYKLYHETRLMLIKEFTKDQDSKESRQNAIYWSQIFLNRLIFIFFVEDNNFIPKKIFTDRLINILQSPSLDESTHSVFDNIKELFSRMNKGSRVLGINEFNGGLFAKEFPTYMNFPDLREDGYFKNEKQNSKLSKKSLAVDLHISISSLFSDLINPIIKNLLIMDSYDFTSDANVNILGHIFEQSISDLEKLAEGEVSKRKKFGIFYTPDYITDYICRNTIIPYLSDKNSQNVELLVEEYKDKIEELETKIKNLKIIDPACGSGAFLVKAVDILLEIDEEIKNYKPEQGSDQRQLDEHTRTNEINYIIENNIYGVDLNEESVEITKLSLFLKLAGPDRKLAYLSNNIKVGNSLIEDNKIDPKGFNWDKEFPEILNGLVRDNGFDIIIGNPPYFKILENHILRHSDEFKEIHKGKMSSASLFINKSLKLLKENGKIGMIVPKAFCYVDSWSVLRKKLLKNTSINLLIDCRKAFEKVLLEQVIFVLTNKCPSDSEYDVGKILDHEFEVKNKINQGFVQKENILFLESELTAYEIRKKLHTNTEKLGIISNIILIYNTKGYSQYKSFHAKKQLGDMMFLRGNDIQRYELRHPLYFDPKSNELGEFHNEIKKLSEPHIVAQRIVAHIRDHIKISSTFVDESVFTFNTVTNIILKNNFKEKYSYYYLTALLNSKLISYYTYKFIYNNSIRTMDFYESYASNIPVYVAKDSEQEVLSKKAKQIIKLKEDFMKLFVKLQNRIFFDFDLTKLNKKLQYSYRSDFTYFLKELQKQSKIKLSLKKQDEWEDYFNEYSKKLLLLEKQINDLDLEIDKNIYELYKLSKNEIAIIEEDYKN